MSSTAPSAFVTTMLLTVLFIQPGISMILPWKLTYATAPPPSKHAEPALLHAAFSLLSR